MPKSVAVIGTILSFSYAYYSPATGPRANRPWQKSETNSRVEARPEGRFSLFVSRILVFGGGGNGETKPIDGAESADAPAGGAETLAGRETHAETQRRRTDEKMKVGCLDG